MMINNNFTFNLVHSHEDQYKCMLNIHIDKKYNEDITDIENYLKMAGFSNIIIVNFMEKIIIYFSFTTIAYNAEGINNMVMDVYDDFMFVLQAIENERKTLKHYPSIINNTNNEEVINF